LRDIVDSLKWDGTERLDNWLSKAVGCPDDSYHRAVGANLIGGLVKRAREPGAKHDETVIFISDEGKSKSKMCKALALRPEWYIDSLELGSRPQDYIARAACQTVEPRHQQHVASLHRTCWSLVTPATTMPVSSEPSLFETAGSMATTMRFKSGALLRRSRSSQSSCQRAPGIVGQHLRVDFPPREPNYLDAAGRGQFV
jgi:hypothetical protein